MSDAVTIGIVGCGRLAEAGYLPALARGCGRTRRSRSPTPTRPRRMCAASSASPASRGDHPPRRRSAARRGRDPTRSSLATPVGTTSTMPAHASDAGVPALLEKPPGARRRRGRGAIVELARPPWIAFNRRFDPGAAPGCARDVVGREGARSPLRARVPAPELGAGAGARRRAPRSRTAPRRLGALAHRRRARRRARARARAPSARVVEVRHAQGVATLTATTDARYRECIEGRTRQRCRIVTRHRRGGVARRGARPAPRAPSTRSSRRSPRSSTSSRAWCAAAAPERLGTAADGHAVMQVLDAARAPSAASAGASITICPAAPHSRPLTRKRHPCSPSCSSTPRASPCSTDARRRAAAGARRVCASAAPGTTSRPRRPRSPPARSTRSTAACPSASTASSTLPVVADRPAGALHGRLPRAAADLGTARPARHAHARGRSLREPAARDRSAGHARVRLAAPRPRRAAAVGYADDARTTASSAVRQARAGRRGVRAAHGHARCSASGAACSGRRAGSPTPPSCTCARTTSTSRGSRSAPRTWPVTSSGTSRRSIPTGLDDTTRRGAGDDARRRLRAASTTRSVASSPRSPRTPT